MKKITKGLLALASVFVLAACSSKPAQITNEEAAKKAVALAEKTEKGEFQIPDKMTFALTESETYAIEMGSEKVEESGTYAMKMVADKDNLYFYTENITTEVEEGKEAKEEELSFIYYKDGKLLIGGASEGTKTYTEAEMSREDAEKTFEAMGESIAVAVASLYVSVSGTALKAIAEATEYTAEVVESLKKDGMDVNVYFGSNGEGSLYGECTMKGKQESEGLSGEVSSTLKAEFVNNLFKTLEVEESVNASGTYESLAVKLAQKASMKASLEAKAELKYVDLKDWKKVEL